MKNLINRAGEIAASGKGCTYAGYDDFIMLTEKGDPVDYFAYERGFNWFQKSSRLYKLRSG